MSSSIVRPGIASRVPEPSERAPMTGWFDPTQLFRTAMQLVISTLFGRNADRRILDAVVHPQTTPCDHSGEDELWIDYVADTGDGWNPTYAIARELSSPERRFTDSRGERHDTYRGQLLVFGGDTVYPTPDRDAYEQRLVAPYRTALAETAAPHPSVFAIPGNHDWYDSLVAFTRLFCRSQSRWFGGRQTQQTLSYFAIKLPHNWWLLGTDVQLDSAIDDPQLEYFRRIAEKEMKPDDRVILCVAEPHWIHEKLYQRFDPTISQRNLDVLENHVLGRRIDVFLSGDIHYYRRHEDAEGRQKITAGIGGAFLGPTHQDADQLASLPDGYTCKKAFPDPKVSRRLAWQNLKFPLLNPTFGVATGLLYLVMAWAVMADLSSFGIGDILGASRTVALALLRSQIAALWTAIILAGFYFFTDTHSPRYRLWAGLTHGLTHIIAAFAISWAASFLTVRQLGLPFASGWQLVLAGAMIFAGGYVVGSMIMGIYLLVSLNVFGRHSQEAFSSLHCEDFKGWLRLHVTKEGALRIFPIKLERVARRWKAAPPAASSDPEKRSLLEPDDPRASSPELIEDPIVCKARRGVPAPEYPGVASPTYVAGRT